MCGSKRHAYLTFEGKVFRRRDELRSYGINVENTVQVVEITWRRRAEEPKLAREGHGP